MREALFLFLIVVAGTGGELCVTRAVRTAGEPGSLHPATLLRFIGKALRSGWMLLGVALMTVAFFSLLAMLSFENVSFVVPLSALSYAAGAAGAAIFLREQVTRERWIGVLVVCIGVTIVWMSKH